MTRDEAIALIIASKMPEVVIGLSGAESVEAIAKRLKVSTAHIAGIAPLLGVSRINAKIAGGLKRKHALTDNKLNNVVQAFKTLVKDGVPHSKAVIQVAANFDAPIYAVVNAVKWAIDDFNNKKKEDFKISRGFVEQVRKEYDEMLGKGFSKSQATANLAELHKYDVNSIRRKLKGFIPINDYKGYRKQKKEEPTAWSQPTDGSLPSQPSHPR